MPTTQSQLQNFIQNTAGTQTTAQSAVPGAANTGNPQTPYNWSSYLPSVTPGAPGAPPSVDFSLLTSQAPASSPGYTPPFTADPYAAMVLQGMPRAQENQNVNNILGNLFGGTNPWTQTPGQPGTGVPPPGTGTPPPSGTTPPPGGTYTPPPGSGGRPIGPISGGIDDWMHSPDTGRPPDGMPITNIFDGNQGRDRALDWLENSQTGRSVGDWLNSHSDSIDPDTGGLDRDSDLWQTVWNGIKDLGGEVGDSLRSAWNDATGANGWQSAVGFWSAVAGIPGVRQILDLAFPDEMVPFELSDETNQNMQDTADENIAEAWARQQDIIDQNFRDMNQNNGGLTQEQILERFPDSGSTWSQQQWDDMNETMSWNNFWYGQPSNQGGGGTRQDTLGVGVGGDFVDQMLRNMNSDALARSEWFRNMRGTIER